MRIAVANRGEVACRIIRSIQELGWRSILLHSEADREGLAWRLADEAVCMSGRSSAETYANINAVCDALITAKADCVHPGFGFLSESASFVEALPDGVTFIGPHAEAMHALGDKSKAKQLARDLGIPTLPFWQLDESDELPHEVTFPLMVKATSAGGGRSLRIIRNSDEASAALQAARREAQNAFGECQLFVERYLEQPMHVEVQVLRDEHGHGTTLGCRHCSIQRRHQKIFEECGQHSAHRAIAQPLIESMEAYALQLTEAADYTNAGTVEFLVDGNDAYFMEANTRLQVEHTVTEMCTGIDLVAAQCAVAQHEKIEWSTPHQQLMGHAIEARIYAEDPAQQFIPTPGILHTIELPLGPFRRFDFGYQSGDTIPLEYDSLIGKVITWGRTRAEAITRLQAALHETIIFGVTTNINFLLDTCATQAFHDGDLHTCFIDKHFSEGYAPPQQPANLAEHLSTESPSAVQRSPMKGSYQSPWRLQ